VAQAARAAQAEPVVLERRVDKAAMPPEPAVASTASLARAALSATAVPVVLAARLDRRPVVPPVAAPVPVVQAVSRVANRRSAAVAQVPAEALALPARPTAVARRRMAAPAALAAAVVVAAAAVVARAAVAAVAAVVAAVAAPPAAADPTAIFLVG
jgi:hypothetical protein